MAVLVIEDDRRIRDHIIQLLRRVVRLRENQIVGVSDEEELTKVYRTSGAFRVIISDLMLWPGARPGYELVALLKPRLDADGTVILLTASPFDEPLAYLARHGLSGKQVIMIAKPYDVRNFTDTVKKALAR